MVNKYFHTCVSKTISGISIFMLQNIPKPLSPVMSPEELSFSMPFGQALVATHREYTLICSFISKLFLEELTYSHMLYLTWKSSCSGQEYASFLCTWSVSGMKLKNPHVFVMRKQMAFSTKALWGSPLFFGLGGIPHGGYGVESEVLKPEDLEVKDYSA